MECKVYEVPIEQTPSSSEYDFQQRKLTTESVNQNKSPVTAESLHPEQIDDVTSMDVTGDDQQPRVNELDKFKRRMIRAIARLMVEEKKPEAEIWNVLRKETSCDCKLLWTRMRALTIKKLKRLYDANDRNENVTKIARLSVTDWLLFDLTLVHEDVDVIGQENEKIKKEPQILEDLFKLVMKYKIEYLFGDPLTRAWNDLTTEYNSRGRKCSQMLLQRRWYQLKQHVRSKFYKFWFEYRGAIKNLEQAEKYKPTNLDVEIVKAYMSIVTDPFPTWQQLIENKRVSLLKDFERLRMTKKKIAQFADDEPDVLLIEPHVETIDLGLDSDEDTRDSNGSVKDDVNLNNEQTADSNDENESLTAVKTESIYDICDEDEVSKLESMHIPLESKANLVINQCDEEIKATNLEKTNVSTNQIQVSHHCVEDEVDLIVNDDDIVNTQQAQENDFEIVMPKITSITSTANILEINLENDNTTNGINNTLDNITDRVPETNSDAVTVTEEKSKNKEEVTIDGKKIKEPSLYNEDVSHDMHLIDGIELEDDGIEYIDEDEHTIEPKEEIKLEADDHISTKDDDDDTPKIDLKLLLNPVVYTKKLEDMDVFRFIDFMTVKDRRVLENAAIESKPVDKKSVKIDTISKECCDAPETNVNSDEASECSTENEYETIKSTSWLFRKPRTATYNPIQLCKNPDFNTRLKRLTAGFFTSQRNRQLLNSCKPLTIDVHKAFEVKLVNNSLFLEKSFVLESQVSETTSTIEKTVLPSELPGQSLNYNVQNATSIPSTSILNRVPNDEVICEACPVKGNKVINLPDLDQIRRKNEGLLIAEVTPLQAVNVNSKPPVSIVQKNMCQENVLNINKVENSDIAKDLNNIHESTTAVSTAELKNKNFSSSDTPVEETEILCNDYRSDFNHVKQSNNQAIKFSNKPRRAAVKYKVGNVAVTWNSRRNSTFHANKQDDRLLAPDTVQRIISVCNGIHQHFTKKQNIANRKKYYRSGPGSSLIKKTVCDEFNLSSQKPQPETNGSQLKDIHSHNTEIKEDQEKQQPATIQKETIHQSEIETETIENCITRKNNYDGQTVKNYGVKNKRIGKKRKNSLCCWAREKILFWNNQIQRVRRHLCPRQKCTCCCNIIYITQLRQRRQKRYTKVSSICNLVSDDDSDHNTENLNDPQKMLKETKETSEKITKRIAKQFNKTSNKVSVGTNTDFDKDFEASYAANVNISSVMNSVHKTQPVITDVLCLDKKGSSSNSTQTFTYTKNESVSSLKFALMSDIIGKEKSHLNNDVESVALNNVLEKVIIKKDKPTKYGPKCKTIVRAATNYIQTASSLSNTNKDSLLCENANNVHAASNYILRAPILSKPDEEGLPTEHPNKVIVLQKNVKTNLSQKPICLGKNKILLCSLQPLSKTSMIDVTHLVENIKPQMINYGINTYIPTLIPNGVHLVLLPNQELVLSIDPGVELNPTQINHLPIILNLVQQQLYALGAINKLPEANILTSDDVIQLSDEETENINADKTHNDNSSLENIKEVRHTPDSKLSDVENDISLNKPDKYIHDDSSSNIASSDTLPVALINEFENENENKPKVDGASESESGKDLSEVDKQQNTFTDDSTFTVDAVLDDDKKEDLNETTKTSKKTIISDLMEMSGISLEDTVVTNTENPINPIPPPQPISIIQEPIKEPNNLYGNKEVEANTNNIFNNPFVQAALTKCPELYIVCSFEDLKYAYKNNGQFYKMDIENGIIVPISVSIKKQMVSKNLKLDKTLKSVIDLTEEENTDNNTFSAELKSEESNIDTFIEKGFSSSGVKPIKLFKSVHPSILRHNFKTLSMRQNSADFNSKKVIKVIKHKRKQVLKTREPKTKNLKKLVHEVEENNIDSESDDEPLALKAKRIRRKSVEISKNIDEVNSHNENSQLEVQPLYEQGVNCDEATSHRGPMSVENQGEVIGSSHLPIIFQSNDDESSEEDCILGV